MLSVVSWVPVVKCLFVYVSLCIRAILSGIQGHRLRPHVAIEQNMLRCVSVEQNFEVTIGYATLDTMCKSPKCFSPAVPFLHLILYNWCG